MVFGPLFCTSPTVVKSSCRNIAASWEDASPTTTVFTHHLIVGILAEPGGQFDGPHKDEEEAQGHREGHDGDSSGGGHSDQDAAASRGL